MSKQALIDRNSLVRYKKKAIGMDWAGEYREDVVSVSTIENFPTVDAEPVVHAHWKQFKYPSGTHGIRCSYCKTTNGRKSKRCPECGAHMDEEVAND